MSYPDIIQDFLLDDNFEQSRLLDMVVKLFDIEISDIATTWEDWANPRLVCTVEKYSGEFPLGVTITPIDVQLCSPMIDHLEFAGRIAEFLHCRVLTASRNSADFGYSESNPYISVLVSGIGSYQIVFVDDTEPDNPENTSLKILYYLYKFSALSDAPVKRLEKVLQTRPFRYYASYPSTNEGAMYWLQDGAVSGSVVIADAQTQGRGRKGRTWHTPAGVALAVSVVLKPPAEFANRISMIAALAVYDLCTSVSVKNVGIKWANDVQINGKKVSGILPEAAWDNGNLRGVVLGMGVNVRVQFEGDLAQTATNLETEAGKSLDRVELIATLLERIDYWMERIASDEVFETWQSRLNTIGQQVEVEGIVGQAQAVDASGALLITVADGSIKRVLAGDVSLIPPHNEG